MGVRDQRCSGGDWEVKLRVEVDEVRADEVREGWASSLSVLACADQLSCGAPGGNHRLDRGRQELRVGRHGSDSTTQIGGLGLELALAVKHVSAYSLHTRNT